MKIAIGRSRGIRPMTTPESNLPSSDAAATDRDQELLEIREALRGLRFGAVNIIVQDGVIVQIDRTEKRRIRRAEPK